MAYPHQPQPGFVLPPQSQSGPYPPQHNQHNHQQGYPPQHNHNHQQGYPPQQQHQQQHYPPNPFTNVSLAPIQQQPGFGGPAQAGGMQWFTSSSFQNYLRNATSFHVKQKVELLEAIVGWETPNKYTVKDQAGNKIFYVGEQSGCCGRQLCASRRPFTLTVKDTQGLDVLTFDRPLDCTCCFGLCCADSLTVSTPSGQMLGSVQEECDLLFPKYQLKNASGNTVLKLQGPFCPMAFNCGQVVFRLTTPDGISVGTISKEWSGLVRELFTDADYFSMSFPPDLDPAMKAVCLGALFLVDFQYFESGHDKSQGGRRLFG